MILKPIRFAGLLLGLAISCSERPNESYEIREGIYFEVKPATADSNFYTHDNQIYQANWEYLFEVSITSPAGDSLLMQDRTTEGHFSGDADLNEMQWDLVSKRQAGSGVVSYLGVLTLPGNMPFAMMIPDYSQSIIELNYYDTDFRSLFKETTGVVENAKNVWIHPHRRKYFRILELNPFPYILLPAKIGTQWTWCLEIGDRWGDYRWKLWRGLITNHYSYAIDSVETIRTKLGSLECFRVTATAKSEIGETYLTAYFNEKLGFVRLKYTNIDDSQVNMELVEIKKN